LMVQIQLGGVDLPDKEFAWKQYETDRSLIFDRIQRLIRCIIDCKSADCDAIATRHALDFARSLSAGSWENSNLQLRQIPGLGPAANRKLVSANINSIEKLASLDSANIERIMTRNPPFGKNMLDSLKGFPRLTLSAEILGNAHSKAGENPKIKVRALLAFSNKKIPIWDKKRPSLTFMAETSDGTLVHFWRGNIQRLEKGTDIKFTAMLCQPGDSITCYVACDEIVGTFRSFRLTSDVPASAFLPPQPSSKLHPKPAVAQADSEVDEFGTGGLEDYELLAAVQDAETPPSECGSDDFADIDELEEALNEERDEKKKTVEVLESVQMENGRWTCNHTCRDGQPLKNGQQCKHRCCKEGIDKPRRVRKRDKVNSLL